VLQKGEFKMWTSSELKERAKGVLSGSYWKAFVVSLVLVGAKAILSGIGGGGRSNDGGSYRIFEHINIGMLLAFVAVFLVVFIVAMFFLIAINVFVISPLEVGVRKYFIEASEANDRNEEVGFGLVGYGYKGAHYMDIVKTMFFKNLFLFGWTLLLIVPGIIKGFAYRMVPYILADNPKIGAKRAIELSNRMTDGEKLDMFILDLSFIGWYLLGAFACLIGVFFVNPYYNSTQAELYRTLRDKALGNGLCTYEELGFTKPDTASREKKGYETKRDEDEVIIEDYDLNR